MSRIAASRPRSFAIFAYCARRLAGICRMRPRYRPCSCRDARCSGVSALLPLRCRRPAVPPDDCQAAPPPCFDPGGRPGPRRTGCGAPAAERSDCNRCSRSLISRCISPTSMAATRQWTRSAASPAATNRSSRSSRTAITDYGDPSRQPSPRRERGFALYTPSASTMTRVPIGARR